MSAFDVDGISPLVDAASPLAFPISLNFNAVTADFDMTANVAAVPEPSSYALLLAGLGAVGFTARRRRSTAITAA